MTDAAHSLPQAPPSPNSPTTFNVERWKRVNAALDAVLDIETIAAQNQHLDQLEHEDPSLALEVKTLLARVEKSANTSPPSPINRDIGLTPQNLAPLVSGNDEHGFDQLLHRALRAERASHKSARYIGEMCGAWQLEEILGSGGMGEVWLAKRADGLFEAKAAVKFLRAEIDTVRFETRFAQERELMARLNHPHIARLLDAGRMFGQPFLVLEYIEGTPLLEYSKNSAKTIVERVTLLKQIAEAIAYAHLQLVVHRDIKPANILVTKSGQIKLLDFGVAGLLQSDDSDQTTESPATKAGGRGLTIEYAAPEQITGEGSGVSSDVYAMGGLAYHLLTGHRAFIPDPPGRAAQEYAVLHAPLIRPSESAARPSAAALAAPDTIPPALDFVKLRGDLDAIISCAMRRNPSDRYRSVDALSADFRRWMERRPISVRREDFIYRNKLWLTRNWLPAALGSTLMASLIVGLGLSTWQYSRAKAEAARANQTADYLVEVIGRANPDLHEGKWPTALNLLEDAARETKTRFANEPETEAKLSLMLAKTYRALSRDTEALPLAERSFALSTQLYGSKHIETIRAQVLLATIQYWADKNTEALKTITPAIVEAKHLLPPESLELLGMRDQYADILTRVYALKEAEIEFRAVGDGIRALPASTPNRDWFIASHDADLAAAITHSGRWQEALDLLRKHKETYDHPPQGFLRQALWYKGQLITFQSTLGDMRDVEQQILSLIDEWRRFAGDKSERIDDLMSDLAFFYSRMGEGKKAESIYLNLQNRNAHKSLHDNSDALQIASLLVENRATFNLASAESLKTEVNRIVSQVEANISPTNQRYRQILLRCTQTILTLHENERAQQIQSTIIANAKDKSKTNLRRALLIDAHLARAHGLQDDAYRSLKESIQLLETFGEIKSQRRLAAEAELTYQLLLIYPRQKVAEEVIQKQMLKMHAAIPEGASANEPLLKFVRLLEKRIQFGDAAPETKEAERIYAASLGRAPSELPQLLVGGIMPY